MFLNVCVSQLQDFRYLRSDFYWRWSTRAFNSLFLLHKRSDIVCYGKSLKDKAVTLATERVFDDFLGTNKRNVLFRRHSYIAHPIGCATTLTALDVYKNGLTSLYATTHFPSKDKLVLGCFVPPFFLHTWMVDGRGDFPSFMYRACYVYLVYLCHEQLSIS
jgi:hypothetical protein